MDTIAPSDCIFCKIVAKEIPSKQEYEDDLCMAFHDINPRAKTHLLIIPKKHVSTMKDVSPDDEAALGRMLKTSSDLAKKFNLENYRLLISTGKGAGQEVFHVHLHLMSAPN
jgi:histidine triad (HIT) family protein